MIWPFSLPPSIINQHKQYRILHHQCADRAHFDFDYVFPINHFPHGIDAEFDLWCQHNHCYYFYDRVLYDRWESGKRRWRTNGIGGVDLLFIATNSETAAIMAKLTWGEVNANEYQY